MNRAHAAARQAGDFLQIARITRPNANQTPPAPELQHVNAARPVQV